MKNSFYFAVFSSVMWKVSLSLSLFFAYHRRAFLFTAIFFAATGMLSGIAWLINLFKRARNYLKKGIAVNGKAFEESRWLVK